MIEAVDLTKEFGNFIAVQDVCLAVPEGEVLALLGPNGAGKTTTVRMLGSILKPTRGYARIAGYDTVTEARQVRRLIGLLTEFPGLYLRMKGLDYLRFFGELQGGTAPTVPVVGRPRQAGGPVFQGHEAEANPGAGHAARSPGALFG